MESNKNINRATRQELAEVLARSGVNFPPTANAAQLRRLHQQRFPPSDEANNVNAVRAAVGAGAALSDAGPSDAVVADDGGAIDAVVAADAAPADAAPAGAALADAASSYDVCPGAERAAQAAAAHAVPAVVAPHHTASGGVETASVSGSNDELVSLDIELEVLRKRREILELRRELMRLEGTLGAPTRRGVDFAELEHAIPKFSGDDDAHSVRHFIRDFEEVMMAADADDSRRLLCLRRCLTGTARVFLSTTSAITYHALVASLIEEFDCATSRQNVYRALSHRRWEQNNESLHRYILTMQSIARRSDISEMEIVGFILDGIEDKVANMHLLMGAQTIAELKVLVNRYQQRYLCRPAPSAGRNEGNTRRQPSGTSQSTNAGRRDAANTPQRQDVSTQRVLCYNCSQTGHIKPNCPYPIRPRDACFRCWKVGHDHRSCRNPKKTLIPVNAAARQTAGFFGDDSDDEDEDKTLVNAVDALNMVSVVFEGSVVPNVLLSLLDTGSPSSFVRRSCVPKYCRVPDRPTKSEFYGVGGQKLEIYLKLNVCIEFMNQKKKINLFVLNDNAMNTPLILGRDFLKKFQIHLICKKLKYSKAKLLELGRDVGYCALDPNSVSLVLERHCLLTDRVGCAHFREANVMQDTSGCGADSGKPQKESEECRMPDVFGIDVFNNGDEINVDGRLSRTLQEHVRGLISQMYLKPGNIAVEPYPCEMKIRLTSDVPFHCPPRRLSYAERTQVRTIVRDLMDDGIVRPSSSPYASAIVLVKKKNGQTRMCIDYRALNKLTVRDNFPLPLIEDCIEYLEGKRYFSTLDLKSGFHQVQMSSDSIPFTSFVTPDGQYEYLKMPFGLKNAPAVFQRFISNIFRDLIEAKKIIIYMDDILIATADFEEHVMILSAVLKEVSRRELQLNLSKCRFCYSEIEYLGYNVNESGISPSDSHITAIKRILSPNNQRELQSCIGLFSYFRRFVPNFSRIARPLLNLLKSNSDYDFNEECVAAFDELKSRLVNAPVLAIYNPDKETELHCDASTIGFGSVLLQRQADGKFHPIAYFSKTTTPAESRYHSFELETLAIIYALRRFRVYLEGVPFTIATDCNSLALTLERKQVNARVARWALELENYNYTIQHRRGSSMGHVDALSRMQVASLFDTEDVDFQIQLAQERDGLIKDIRNKLMTASVKGFELSDGLVYRLGGDGQRLLYVPTGMEDNIIRSIHEGMGHQSIDKCRDKIAQCYWFPAMRDKVDRFIGNCVKCLMYAVPLRAKERNLHNIPKVPLPFDTIHIDHFGPLPSISSKRKHILVVVDAFTKFVKLYPTNSTSTREVTAALDKYFSYYSRPRRVISDRGTAFTSLEFGEFLLKKNISHVKVAVASPQANGQVERVNRVLKAMLGKLSEPINHADWSSKLNQVEYAINNTMHSSTKNSPSMLLFGVEQRGRIIDELTEFLSAKTDACAKRELATIRSNAAAAIERSQNYNLEYFLKNSVKAKKYSENDLVVVRNVDVTVGTNKKFMPRYRGPYVIHKVLGNDRYVVRDVDNCQLTQLPYDGVIEANRIRKWVTECPDRRVC